MIRRPLLILTLAAPLAAACHKESAAPTTPSNKTEAPAANATAEDVLGALPERFAMPPACAAGTFVVAEPEPPLLAPPDSPVAGARARQSVLGLLSAAPTAVDDLVRRCQLSPSAVAAVLLELELAGRVEALPGGQVTLLAGAL